MRTIRQLAGREFDNRVSLAGVPVIADVYTTWCGSCKLPSLQLESFAAHFPGLVKFFNVNVDNAPELAARFPITGVPSLLFFEHRNPNDRIVGLGSPRGLGKKLEAFADAKLEAGA